MEVREIKTLIALMSDHGLVELEIEDKKGKVRLVRGTVAHVPPVESNSVPHVASPVPKAQKGRAAATSAKSTVPVRDGSGPLELAANQKLIESPMVGTFYRAASPDSAPFVEEGSSVRKGQPICIIEAMKMMNEIEAPSSGRIVKILAENAQPVEYGQALMIVEVG
ncbi:MAG: acetyl-CoA carboxylase biotin carboxyl carrier protein [Candidatus Binataceae bacterium]